MSHLWILGTADLTGAEGQHVLSVLAQPKRVALLAYLALATPDRFQRRDRLLALLWPESEPDRARNSLRQALHFLRRALGNDTLPGRGDGEVGVDFAALTCDAVEFEEELDRGDLARALELYRGDLLESFFISDAPLFERWLEDERVRLRRRASTAAWQLSEQAKDAGDSTAAVAWAQRGQELDPYDEINIRRLIELLNSAGNRGAAVRTYESFVSRLQEEFDLEPSPETVALIEAIRARSDQRPAEANSPKDAAAERRLPEAPIPDHAAVPPATTATAAPATTFELAHATQVAPARRSWRPWARSRRWLMLASMAAAFGLIVAYAGRGILWPQRDRVVVVGVKTLAVLPFRNLSAQIDDEYFTEGFQEELLARLSKVRAFRVTARNSVLQYRREPADLGAVGGELNVRYLIQGSVQSREEKVKISARLVDSVTGEELWADTYERRRADLFSIQVDVAERIADALQVHFSPEERTLTARRPTRNDAAYEAYLRGRVHWSRAINRDDAQSAARFFEWAVVIDPEFANAQAALSYARTWLAYVFGEHDKLEGAKQALNRAIALAPDATETRLAEAYYLSYLEKNYEDAIARLSQVIEVQPSLAEALALMGSILRRQGRFQEAAATMSKALELDPNAYNTTVVLGEMYQRMGQIDEAERQFERAITISPHGELAYAQKALLYLYGRGDTTDARRIVEEAPTTFSARYRTLPALMAVVRRDYNLARELLIRPPHADTMSSSLPEDLLLLGLIYRLSGRPDLALLCADSILLRVSSSRAPDDAANAAGSQWPEALAHSYRAMAYVLMDRPDDAIRQAEKAVSMIPVSLDTHDGTEVLRRLADVYALVGRHAQALATLELLLSVPSRTTTHILELHPIYDSLRDDAQFRRMLSRHMRHDVRVTASIQSPTDRRAGW